MTDDLTICVFPTAVRFYLTSMTLSISYGKCKIKTIFYVLHVVHIHTCLYVRKNVPRIYSETRVDGDVFNKRTRIAVGEIKFITVASLEIRSRNE